MSNVPKNSRRCQGQGQVVIPEFLSDPYLPLVTFQIIPRIELNKSNTFFPFLILKVVKQDREIAFSDQNWTKVLRSSLNFNPTH